MMMKHIRFVSAFLVVGLSILGALAPGAGQSVFAAGEWYAEYFNNATLTGPPVATRYETDLHFEWGYDSPADGVPVDDFSARLVRDVWFEGGTYRFTYRADDGLRIWVNDVPVVDDWQDQAATWSYIDHTVPAGVNRVRVEYYERGGYAAVQIGWRKIEAEEIWSGAYYDNTNLAGDPVFKRGDAAIDFDWGYGSPDPAVPDDDFSARWARTLGFEAGTYRVYASSDDGVRIYVDGQRIVDAWHKQKLPNTHHGDVTLSAGNHEVVIDYFEEGGEAGLHVWWDRLDPMTGWRGRYFDNRELRGGPALIRSDGEINFDWGEGAPASWMPSDNFSASWTKTLDLAPGYYRFNTRADDGVRLWIDDVDLRLNHWEEQEFVWHYQDWHYLEGTHTLRVEYFDRTGNARIQFWWDYAPNADAAREMSPSPTYRAPGVGSRPAPAPSPVPPSQPSATPPGPWTGEYFADRDLSGDPVLVRTDPAIDFDWSWAAPTESLPVDEFAVRWTGTFDLDAGTYRLKTVSDDGIRVYVDDRLVISSWRPMRGTRYATVSLSEGAHTVRVEYFEARQAAKAQFSWTKVN
jgi:hypothetical protein